MIKKLFKSATKADCYKLLALIICNTLFCGFFVFVYLFIIDNLILHFNLFDIGYDHAQELIIVAFWAVLAITLISNFRVWLLSLPIQLILYFGIVAFVYGHFLEAPIRVSVQKSAQFVIQLLTIQILGAAIGYLIRLFIRKRRNRKQALPAA